jgi:ubiquinone/menaquinone biosynthesis C-methylase UbiE
MLKVAARFYDRLMAGVEEAGLGAWRAELLAPLHGSVLEVGAGTGRNINLYPAAVTTLILAEPDRHMRALLHRAVEASPIQGSVVDAAAERLPFDDACFDAVVSTLVLCSVADQLDALAEIRRVLRPGGTFVFIEHVAAQNRPRRVRWQHRIEPCWRLMAGNCHLTRDTEAAIGLARLEITEIERSSMRKAPPVVRPTIRGRATRD